MQNAKRLLLVEDSTSGHPSVRRALEELGAVATLVHVTSVEEAVACLSSAPLDRPSLTAEP